MRCITPNQGDVYWLKVIQSAKIGKKIFTAEFGVVYAHALNEFTLFRFFTGVPMQEKVFIL